MTVIRCTLMLVVLARTQEELCPLRHSEGIATGQQLTHTAAVMPVTVIYCQEPRAKSQLPVCDTYDSPKCSCETVKRLIAHTRADCVDLAHCNHCWVHCTAQQLGCSRLQGAGRVACHLSQLANSAHPVACTDTSAAGRSCSSHGTKPRLRAGNVLASSSMQSRTLFYLYR